MVRSIVNASIELSATASLRGRSAPAGRVMEAKAVNPEAARCHHTLTTIVRRKSIARLSNRMLRKS
ncbi:hypothetical protein [Sphingobium cloacae]|uniref:hypothetical protein n=1 Tax=Sphingobium cloacae TaxID=120107 RepID=UPI001E502CA1|nr:hypothetical protein [Sphingobium cloacae]